jgi:hypothetical protein
MREPHIKDQFDWSFSGLIPAFGNHFLEISYLFGYRVLMGTVFLENEHFEQEVLVRNEHDRFKFRKQWHIHERCCNASIAYTCDSWP